MEKRLSVALVMPVLNEEDSVERTLDSVYKSTRLPDEIIIADGLSTDKTVEKIKAFADGKFPVKILKNHKVYAGAGRNVAVEASKSDIIMLLDFGNTIAPEWIEEMVNAFDKNKGVDIITGVFYPEVSSDYEHCVAAINYHINYMYMLGIFSLDDVLDVLPERPDIGALSIAFTRKIWLKAGGMPDWLRSAEDKLFGNKLVANNAKIDIAPKAILFHHMRSTPLQLFLQNYTYNRGNGKILFVRRHLLKILAFYSFLFTFFIAGIYFPLLLTFNVFLTIFYVYRNGLSKIIAADKGLKKKRYLYIAPMVVFPRDVGLILGAFVGVLEWLFSSKYRHNLKSYLKDVSTSSYSFIQHK